MNVVIAIDSFKGSITSRQAGEAAKRSALEVFPEASVHIFPLADGGEGTVDTLVEGLGGEIVPVNVTGPLGTLQASRYGYIKNEKRAIIEMADAAGLPSVPKEKRNPLNTTTYGLGELILSAANNGCRDFFIGIGGSATNDAGLGMLTALGARFFDEAGEEVGILGGDLAKVKRIDLSKLAPVLKECRFQIACDVDNPLCGERGCSAVYGPQKGATPEIVYAMDKSIDSFARLVKETYGIGDANLAGAGAAGGLGFAFHTFLNAELAPGIELILDALGIKSYLLDADIVITGEGRMDSQTAMGKGPAGLAKLAHKVSGDVKVIAFCGCALPDAEAVNECGIDAYFPILHMPSTVEEAMQEENALTNLRQSVKQALRLVKTAM